MTDRERVLSKWPKASVMYVLGNWMLFANQGRSNKAKGYGKDEESAWRDAASRLEGNNDASQRLNNNQRKE